MIIEAAPVGLREAVMDMIINYDIKYRLGGTEDEE